jgi:hypothetical protein
VPRLLSDDHKENCVEINQELLASANGNENFLKNIITGDETWVLGYDVETNAIIRVDGERVSFTKKARMSQSEIKVLLVVFFDWKGIVHPEFLPRGQVLNKQIYQEVLARLRNSVHRK